MLRRHALLTRKEAATLDIPIAEFFIDPTSRLKIPKATRSPIKIYTFKIITSKMKNLNKDTCSTLTKDEDGLVNKEACSDHTKSSSTGVKPVELTTRKNTTPTYVGIRPNLDDKPD